MEATIIINGNESITLYMLLMDRIEDCDKNWKISQFYNDVEGIDYWFKEKALAVQLQHKLDEGFLKPSNAET